MNTLIPILHTFCLFVPLHAALVVDPSAPLEPAAVQALKTAAEDGDAEAAFTLGEAFASGNRGLAADAVQAESWLRKAIELGHEKATERLGRLFLETSNQGRDVTRAAQGVDILKEAAPGDAASSLTLGQLHLNGLFVPQDFDNAEIYFRQAANLGSADGWYQLGRLHSGEVGFADRIQPGKGLEHLEKAFEAGHIEAGRLLVKMLREGTRVPKDEARAFQVVSKAAELGSVQARFFLGDLYADGAGVEANPRKALQAYRAAAEEGYPVAQNKMGMLTAAGEGGVEKKPAEARQWFRKAAEQGFAPAHLNLALLLDAGAEPGSEQARLAVEHLVAAANAGLTEAQDRLGSWYRDGRHVPRDLVAAAAWFRPAANAGNLTAKINLAQILESTAVQQNALQTALALYNDAAKAGHPLAHYHLARMLLAGRAGVFNPVAAYAHLATAGEAGLPLAQEALPGLKSRLSQEQIRQAEQARQNLRSFAWNAPPAEAGQ